MSSRPIDLLRELFDIAVDTVHPTRCVPPHLPAPPTGRTVVVGAGKAAAAMAQAVEAHWPADCEGLVVTRYGHGVPCRTVQVVEASHPVPDDVGQRAATKIIELVSGLTEDDLVICLISGGGSALLSSPAPGITLAAKQDINRQLLKSGANIHEMNCVRKHLSAIKGGQLALRCGPAQVATLILSDVPGDDPATVASGPTVPDPTFQTDARSILQHYRIVVDDPVLDYLSDPDHETPKPGDPRFQRVTNTVIATANDALRAAAERARQHGVPATVWGDDIEGEARTVAAAQADRLPPPRADGARVYLSGGETTVTVRGAGRGGRNVEYLLGLALALPPGHRVHALACDTDGIDGTEDNAGAVITPDTLNRAQSLGLDPRQHLTDNDAYGFFAALGDLVVTGPTRTNVNDFRAILIDASP